MYIFSMTLEMLYLVSVALCINYVCGDGVQYRGGVTENKRQAIISYGAESTRRLTKYAVEEDYASSKRHEEMGLFGKQLFLNGYPAYINEDNEIVPMFVGGKRNGSQRRILKKQQMEKQSDQQELKHPTLTEELKEIEEKEKVTGITQDEDDDAQKFKEHLQTIIDRPGILANTVHAMIIDAGSTGSRLHVYEFAPRILETREQVNAAVAGNRLSFPGTESRWTERLRPGLNTFASIEDDAVLHDQVKAYLDPLIEFAKSVLHTKQNMFGLFPIYLKATGGMRTLPPADRQRLMRTVRELFYDDDFCPFWFEEEFARVISGEEEAIYGWSGINFLMGTLLENSEGSGTVMNPDLTYGALDLGGASTQISFFDPNQDIMSNLFKLQVGAAKHWNVYTHSYLMFGANAAYERLNARLYYNATRDGLLETNRGAYNPCLPRDSIVKFTSKIHVDPITGMAQWPAATIGNSSSTDGTYTTLVRNDDAIVTSRNLSNEDDAQKCVQLAYALLNKDASNAWCNFEHKNDCSFAGVYQPPLPLQSDHFGEFLAFSNYHHVFDFLDLDDRSSMQQLRDGITKVCNMNISSIREFNSRKKEKRRASEEDLVQYCFRASYTFALLHHGYGFGMDKFITAKHKINGHKVTWAIGSVLYEINTLPWNYEKSRAPAPDYHPILDLIKKHLSLYIALLAVAICAVAFPMYTCRKKTQTSKDRPWNEQESQPILQNGLHGTNESEVDLNCETDGNLGMHQRDGYHGTS